MAAQNQEMNEFLQQFPLDDANISSSLTRLENDVTAIRSKLDIRAKKMTLLQISAKIDYLMSVLVHNGFTLPDQLNQSSTSE